MRGCGQTIMTAHDGMSAWLGSSDRRRRESDLIRFDVALTVCTMRYVSDLHIGRVNPREFHYDLEISHTKFDLAEFLRQKLVASQDVDSALQSAEPPFPLYHRTKAALATYLAMARQDDSGALTVPAKTVKPGDSYAGVPRLAKLLALVGDIPGEGQHGGQSLPRRSRPRREAFSAAARPRPQRPDRRAYAKAIEYSAEPSRRSARRSPWSACAGCRTTLTGHRSW